MFGPFFSTESKNRIQSIGNILNRNFRSQGFEVSVYFSGSGTYSIDIISNGCIINKFLFSAAYDNSGEIDSIAIYGSDLAMYQRNISASKSIFGLPVDRIETDYGNEPFLDVYLER